MADRAAARLLFHGWFARPGPYTALLAILGVAALNTSLLFAPAALASLIVAGVVAWWRPRLPRLTRYWFYPFYPTHFAVIRWIGSQKFALTPAN
jgi:hypothetical protein